MDTIEIKLTVTLQVCMLEGDNIVPAKRLATKAAQAAVDDALKRANQRGFTFPQADWLGISYINNKEAGIC